MVPPAVISHQTSDRLRIKITSRKGEDVYFARLSKELKKKFHFQGVQANALTGSVLIRNPEIDLDAIAAYTSAEGICRLDTRPARSPRLVDTFILPLREINRKFRQYSGDEIGIHEIVFIALCGFGVFEVIRGNFRPPPWYTAFWYAFGVFTKSLVDRSAERDEGKR